MKISAVLELAKKKLIEKNIENPALDALLLLIQATSFTKEKIIFNPDLLLNYDQQKLFFEFIERRANYEPISHIIEAREFFGRKFIVNKDVLDPRPDTETLIEEVLSQSFLREEKIKILELGVGSGCLIITLLASYKNADGIGVDISKKALEIAKQNAILNAVEGRLELLESDLFQNIAEAKFDLIISNPPYIPSAEIENLQIEVKNFEPRTALDGGLDGLDFYRRIAEQAKNFFQANGKIIVEIGFGQEKEVSKIFVDNGFKLLNERPDLAGIIRVLTFCL